MPLSLREVSRWALAAALVLGGVPSAHAFTTMASFNKAAIEGGGGGRHFTGSPRDGQDCSVCHRGGTEPTVMVTGLPEEGFDVERSYTFDFRWAGDFLGAILVEVVDGEGRGAGTMAALAPGELSPEETCAAGGGGIVVALNDQRQVIGTDACGLSRLRARWTAPNTGIEQINVYASFVAGNRSADPRGDGVILLKRAFPIRGGSARGPQVGSGCQAAPSSGQGAPWAALGFLSTALVLRRRRLLRRGQ